MEDQVPIFISPRNRVAQLHPQALGSLYVVSYDSQCYGRGILTLLQPGWPGLHIYIYPSGTGWSSQKPKSRYDQRPVNQYFLVPSPLDIKGVPSERIAILHQEMYIKANFICYHREGCMWTIEMFVSQQRAYMSQYLARHAQKCTCANACVSVHMTIKLVLSKWELK
jgi:hypothetical protein